MHKLEIELTTLSRVEMPLVLRTPAGSIRGVLAGAEDSLLRWRDGDRVQAFQRRGLEVVAALIAAALQEDRSASAAMGDNIISCDFRSR